MRIQSRVIGSTLVPCRARNRAPLDRTLHMLHVFRTLRVSSRDRGRSVNDITGSGTLMVNNPSSRSPSRANDATGVEGRAIKAKKDGRSDPRCSHATKTAAVTADACFNEISFPLNVYTKCQIGYTIYASGSGSVHGVRCTRARARTG